MWILWSCHTGKRRFCFQVFLSRRGQKTLWLLIRDWLLITGRMGGYNTGGGGGGMGSFTPTERGAKNVLAMLKGGHKQFWGISFTQ